MGKNSLMKGWKTRKNRRSVSWRLWCGILLAAFLLAGCGVEEQPVYLDDLNISGGNEAGGNEDLMLQEQGSLMETPEPEGTLVSEGTPEQEATLAPEPTPEPEPEEKSIQLMMLGDNLMHMGIVNTGKQADGTYNFDFLFEGIQAFLEEAEIRMINQETIFGGNEQGFSGYPAFNSPTQVGDAIVNAGFNVVLHASNHAADRKIEGLLNCVEYWEQYPEMVVAGIHGEENESAIEILTIEGIDFAILNYTYGPNLETLPNSVKGRLDMLCNYDENTGRIDFTTIHPNVLADIAQAKEMADVVIVCPHWGTEYTTTPSSYQEKFALQMTEAGADIIIGTHPHVVQPVEWIEAENGNRALCYYSLGNYVSTQKDPLCMLEGMAWIQFTITDEGISMDEEMTGVIPLVCHYTANPVRLESVYLLEDYTEEKAAAHGIRSYGGVSLYLNDLLDWTEGVFGENVLTAEKVLGEWTSALPSEEQETLFRTEE